MSTFGERVRQLRESRNFTLQELADRAGINIRRLSRIESGAYEAKLDAALGLAKALDTTVEYLSGEIDDPRPFVDVDSLSVLERVALSLRRGDKIGAIRIISEYKEGDAT